MTIGKQFSLVMVLVLLAASFVLIWVPQVSAADPVTTLVLEGDYLGSSPTYVNDFTTFKLTAKSDAGTSITGIWYRWDDNPYVLYEDPITAALFYQIPGGPPAVPMELIGAHTLYYNSTDDSGNIEPVKSYDVFVDPVPPTSGVVFSVVHYENLINYITSDTTISLSAVDLSCGLDAIYYAIGDAQFSEFTDAFTISGSGSRTLNYYSIDNLGNKEIEKSINLFIDNSNPTFELDIGEPSYVLSGTTYANTYTDFTITASDDSGISLIQYNVGGASWKTYTDPFYLTQSGIRVLNIEVTDNLGMVTTEAVNLNMDNSPPVITSSLSGLSMPVVDYNTAFYLNATDEANPDSVCIIYYSLDDGSTWYKYSVPITLTEDVNITYYAEDSLGNSGSLDTVIITVNPQNNLTKYIGVFLIIAGVGIVVLIYLNRGSLHKPREEESEPVKKNRNKSKKKR